MGVFRFKRFSVDDAHCGMKVGTDSVLLGAWAEVAGAKNILDIGTGSGLLALMAAQRCKDAEIIGIELDADACADAQTNVTNSPWNDRIRIINVDAFTHEPYLSPDLILCNPPYFISELISPDKKRATARHSTARDSHIGLSAESAIDLASRWLSPTGAIALVTPKDGTENLVFGAEMKHLHLRRKTMVRTRTSKQPTRILWQFSRIDGPLSTEELEINSPEYYEIVKDFYL